MTNKRRLFRAYPACRYQKGKKPLIVRSKTEDELALSQGWAKTPIQDVLDDLPPELKQQPDVIEKITSATDSVAAVCNMLTRISKVRSKKDLRWLAAELNIELPGDGYSLKQLKKIILDEARIHPDFSDLVLPEPPNQPPNNASGDTYEHGATTH